MLTSSTAAKMGAIVAGQTSVKAPEKAAFEKYLPEDVHILRFPGCGYLLASALFIYERSAVAVLICRIMRIVRGR